MPDRVEFFQMLAKTPRTQYRLAAKRIPQTSNWKLHTLILDIFPERWFSTAGSPLEEHQFLRATHLLGDYAFLKGEMNGQTLVNWLSGDEASINGVYSGPGQQYAQFKLEIPDWAKQEGNLNTNQFYSWQPYRSPALPFPHTSFQIYGNEPMQDIRDTAPIGGDGYHYPNFSAALREQIYGDTDRQQSLSFFSTPIVVVRLVEGAGFFREIDIFNDKTTAKVWGMGLFGSHLNVSDNKGKIDDQVLQVPGTFTISFSREIEYPLHFALYNNDSVTLDYFVFTPNGAKDYLSVHDKRENSTNPSLEQSTISTESAAINRKYKFDVAISFAGPQRELAAALAAKVKEAGYKVFYDKEFIVEVWGKDLYEYLDNVYRKEARYCVMLVSSAYVERMWTSHERRSAQARALEEREEGYLLPIMIEQVEVPGLRPTTSYLSIQSNTIDEIGDFLVEKLGVD